MSMQNSTEYFLSQESFKNWVLGQNEEDCRYWDAWMKENPDQMPAAVLAAQIYTGLQSGRSEISQLEIQSEWLKLKSRIEENKQKKDDVRHGGHAEGGIYFIFLLQSHTYLSCRRSINSMEVYSM